MHTRYGDGEIVLLLIARFDEKSHTWDDFVSVRFSSYVLVVSLNSNFRTKQKQNQDQGHVRASSRVPARRQGQAQASSSQPRPANGWLEVAVAKRRVAASCRGWLRLAGGGRGRVGWSHREEVRCVEKIGAQKYAWYLLKYDILNYVECVRKTFGEVFSSFIFPKIKHGEVI